MNVSKKFHLIEIDWKVIVTLSSLLVSSSRSPFSISLSLFFALALACAYSLSLSHSHSLSFSFFLRACTCLRILSFSLSLSLSLSFSFFLSLSLSLSLSVSLVRPMSHGGMEDWRQCVTARINIISRTILVNFVTIEIQYKLMDSVTSISVFRVRAAGICFVPFNTPFRSVRPLSSQLFTCSSPNSRSFEIENSLA